MCIFLWLLVDVIKTMMAKLMANHFHQETYFQRMQEALRKVPPASPSAPQRLRHEIAPGLLHGECATEIGTL